MLSWKQRERLVSRWIVWVQVLGLVSFVFLFNSCLLDVENGKATPQHHAAGEQEQRFIQVAAQTKEERTAIANFGVSIEAVRTDSIWGFAHPRAIEKLQNNGFLILGEFDYSVARGGHDTLFDFPVADARFHNYEETISTLQNLVSKHADIVRIQKVGHSTENREVLALHFNTHPEALRSGQSHKPGVVFMGAHHAREHLSVEIPLMLAEYLLDNREDAQVWNLLDSRDIWIIPMVNPDGAEWDIQTGKYRWWRKNRRNNGDGTYGVDLNRNYSYQWGTGGADPDTASDTYRGTGPFSEPETQAIKKFIEEHLNVKVLLTFHTFSELILYPWGHKYEPIENQKDRASFQAMAQTMAGWNHYKPQQSSALYIASGDTTDWAYGTYGIFAFTFELSPRNMFEGGFYPGTKVIDKVFQDNLKPCLYLIDLADDPYKATPGVASGWLQNYREPTIPYSLLWERHFGSAPFITSLE